MRDTLLFVAGELDDDGRRSRQKSTEPGNLRRTVYGSISRRQLDGTLALFDFPNPDADQRRQDPTATPLQQLFFLNSEFIQERANALAAGVAGARRRPAPASRSLPPAVSARKPKRKDLSWDSII